MGFSPEKCGKSPSQRGAKHSVTTDTTERGLETLICEALAGPPDRPATDAATTERPASYGAGWLYGEPDDYDREFCVDLAHLSSFLRATQPETAKLLDLDQDSPTRRQFLSRLRAEISRRGTVDVLRNGINHGPHYLDLFYGAPSRSGTTRPWPSTARTVSA